MNDEYIKKWHDKQLLKQITQAKGNGTSLITLIIPAGSQISKTQQLLTDEYRASSNIKDHKNKLSVQNGIKSAQERLKLYKEIPQKGLVLCVGTVLIDNNKEKKMTIDFEPFKLVNKSIYRCDNKFHIDILDYLFEDDDKYGFIIVDGNGSLYGIVSGDTKKILYKFTVDLPKKHGRGGQSAQRFGRIRDEKRHNYIRKVAEEATKIFITNDMPNVAGIILAGSGLFKNTLEKSDLFDQRLKTIVRGVFDVAYGGEAGFNQAVLYSGDLIKKVKLIREEKLLLGFFTNINMQHEKMCYGIKDTMYALINGAIEKLIIWDDLMVRRIVYKNNISGDKQIVYIKDDEIIEQMIGYDIKSDNVLLEWLLEPNSNNIEHYKKYCKRIELVSDKSSEGNQFVIGFGGMGGFLRFAIDYPQDSDDFASFDSEDFI